MEPRPQSILDYREYPVLYVDDEPENLRIFELTFRRDFSVLTAQSGDEALEILNSRPVSLLLSDQRMPGMSGVELLTRARALDPKVLRVLVTAYGDMQTLAAAVNDGSIYKYVPKPWTPEEMEQTLRRGIEMYALDRERESLVRELTTLNRVSNSINKQLDLDRLGRLILDMLVDDLGYDAAALLFLDAAGEELAVAQCAPEGGPVQEWLRTMAIAAREAPEFVKAVEEGGAQILKLEEMDQFERPVRIWLTEVAAEQMMLVPLLGKERVIGALVVDNRRGGHSFGSSDHTMMRGLAMQAVIALENAQLVEDLRRSREQVVRADRLGTLGTLAAGLAHEINNPLTSIHTFLSLAPEKRDADDPEFWNEYHEVATHEVERIRGLVASMERLASGGSASNARPESCRPADLAEAAARLLEREADRFGVELRLEHESELPHLHAVRDQLHQVLLNLVLNAIHAASSRSGGGHVDVRVQRAQTEEGEAVAFEVCDDGPGISPDALEHLFDPFFTTKGPDQGTGLGLSICQQLVANHDGSIEVRSREGAGASFRVVLPAGGASGETDRKPCAA